MPKCDKDCNTPKVLEIHNHECPVLFHRVVVPAAIGDDETNPPRNGQYRNVLLVYEANGHVYLFSSDGIPTFISDGGQGVDDYNELLNKPSINGYELIGDSSLEDIGVTDAIDDALEDYTPTADLAAVALSGDYNDLSNTPTIPVVNDATLTITRNNVSAGTFTANSATDTSINIAVPTATSDLTNDSGFITNTVNNLVNYYTKTETDTAIGVETSNREDADQGLQEQIDAISSSSDVVDVVGTYAELQAYDTSKLGDNDIIKVLTDETHDDAISYYRWNDTTETFTYIGSQGPFYTKSETDATFVPQTRTINGKGLNSDVVLTAADVNALPASTVIPTVNDATLTIKKNGTTVTTFTANSAQNATADISVPTKVSDLTNDLDFVEGADLADVAFSGDYADLTGTPSIPTKTSDLTNDSNFVSDANYVHTDNNFTTTLKNKLNGIAAGAEVNVQSDWNVTDSSSDAFIKNKPSIPTKTSDLTNDSGFITSAAVPTKTSDLTNDSGFITKNVSDLTNYYTETEINSMFNALPAVPTKTSDLTNDSGFLTTSTLPIATASRLGVVKIGSGINVAADGTISAAVASLDWANITNKPTNVSYWTNDAGYITSAALPTKTSDLTNDSGFITSAALPTKTSDLTNDSGFITSSVNNLTNYYKKSETYTQGEVNSLLSAIVVPTKTSDLTNDGADGTSTYVEADDLATVATSGSYTDLSDKPTIGNATLTIQKNGTNVQTFTANATSNKTANITVPTKTSDLTNDSNFVTNTSYATASTGGVVKVGGGLEITNGVLSATGGGTADAVEWDNVLNKPTFSTVATSGSYNDLTDKPTIPTVNNATLTIQRNSTNVGTFTANASSNKTINITVPTTAADVSALPASTKYGASITVSLNTTDYKMTTTLKDQDGNTLGTAQTIDLPLESVVVNGSYDSTNKKIVLTLQNGNTIDIPVGDLIAGLQTEITSTNKLSSDLVDDTNHTHKFVTAAQITKLNGIAAGAEVNVQSDWNQTTTTADDYIKNKPSIPTKTSDLNNDSGFITTSALSGYLPLTGGTLTGKLTGTQIETGTAADNYFQSQKFRGQGDASSYYHAIDFGYGGHNQVDFYEYGGVWNFWRNTSATATTDTNNLALGITLNALKNKAYTYTFPNKTGTFALTSDLPTVNNGTLTIQKNGTNVQTFTANQSGNATANITVPTKTSELTNDSSFVTSSGTVAKANQLTTPRTIAISGGATGTATSFSGASNISIPITGMYETYLNWGNQNLSGRVSPIDAALSEEFSANRLAYMDASKITVEYSRDGGSTWTDYGLTAAQKTGLVTTSQAIYTGGTNSNAASNYQVRVDLHPTNPYMSTRKLFVYISTGGVSNAQVLVERKGMNDSAYTTVTTATISGWSGWNSIPLGITFGGTSSWSNSNLRLTFSYNGKSESYPNAQLNISKIRLYGETAWSAPSNLATNGHLYTYDTSQNATFPANVKVTGSLQHGNYTYTLPNKNGTVAMTSDIPSALTVDSTLSTTSTNPVQNKVITANFDNYATNNSVATQLANKQNVLTAGDHINITGSTIKAVDYVHSENPVSTSAVTPVVTGNMISNGTITADKLATGATLKLTLSTSDIGEGAALAANTLYGVYQ